MDPEFIYCPVLKGKLNDIKAMSFVTASLSASIKPLYELPPFLPTDKPEQVLARFATRLATLAKSQLCYVDFPLLKPGIRTSSGESALQAAFGQLNALHVPFEPVYGFDRDDAMWPLVVRQAHRAGGLLLRLTLDDVEYGDETIERVFDLRRRSLDHRLIDVMIDCRYLETNTTALTAASEVADFVEKLASRVAIRKYIVAGSSAPKTVSAIAKDSCGHVFRNELTLWTCLATERLPVEIIYSDYGVIHPDFSDLTLSTNINGKIRYTDGSSFRIFRGHSLRIGDKFEQYRKLSASLLSSKYYQGNTYSHGDRYVYDCATGQSGTGNAGTWVLVDQNHHITYALNQVRRLRSLVARGMPPNEIVEHA